MMKVFRSFSLGIAFCVAIGASSFAGDSIHTWDFPRFSDDAAAMYKAASNAKPADGTDVEVLDDEGTYVFDADAKAIRTEYLVYKVLTQRGAEGWGGISVNWEPWHEQRPVIRARVITADNVAHPLDAKTISDAPATNGENDIYTDARQVRAPLPAIAPGSLVEEEETFTESAPIFDGGAVRRFYFGMNMPVQHTRLVLDSPASLTLRYDEELLPAVQPERTEKDGRVRVTFDSGPMDALENADASLPSDVPAYPHVTFSTGGSWREVAEDYGKIVDRQIALGDVKQLTDGLISGKKTREEKAAAILQYLDREVRYTGVEFGSAAITPHSPAETLQHKYGDCKDKATLLIAMLRAAGIPGYVALLDAGTREDVAPTLPGMGLFDHAIVYAPGTPDLWIDATDERARLGELAPADQGRLALIARSGSDALVQTPVSSSSDNLLIERREIHLAEYGPARIIEVSEPHGNLESIYRSDYGDPANKDRRKELSDYVASQYLAEHLDRVDCSDATDISKQFTLTLEADHAKRGSTDLDSAAAAIRLESVFNRLPGQLQQREEEANTAASKEKPKKVRTADYELSVPFVTEWQYKIVPPPGFRAKPLPANADVSLGPAKLTETFSAEKDGTIDAVIRFDSVKRRVSVAEATEMRNKIARLREGEAILIFFEPVADALLNAGNFRESFQAYRDLIALHPTEALHHLQLARALLATGLGQAARDEARRAVTLEPNSALAQETLADVLESDLVGRRFRPGSDYDGAEGAFQAAEKLDPDDHTIPGNLGILLEYNHDGERYGPGAKLKESVAAYQSLTREQLAKIGLRNNPPFTLFYAHEFAAAKEYAESLNPQVTSVIVASEAAMNGSQAGIAEARKRTGGEDESKSILQSAGELLMRARVYPAAADLFEAGASGDNASNTLALAAVLHKARPHESLEFKDDAAGAAMKWFLVLADPGLTVAQLMDASSHDQEEVLKLSTKAELETDTKRGRILRHQLSATGFPADVMVDVLMQSLEPLVEGNDSTGYRVTLRAPDRPDLFLFFLREEGKLKIVDSTDDSHALALEALDRISAGDVAGARVLFDWVRDNESLPGGDDPLAGPPFPRMWTKGKEVDTLHMKMSAAGLLVQTRPLAQRGVTILESVRNSVSSDADKLNVSLGLMSGYESLDDFGRLLTISRELAKQFPDSQRLFEDQELALLGLGKFEEADALAEDRLKRLPNDIRALRDLVFSAVGRGDYKLAHERSSKVVGLGKAEANDFNELAWISLFTGEVDSSDVDAATRAAQLSQNNNWGILHTLGCVYAEVGKTKEAREVLIQAMNQANFDEPDSNFWYAFGRIAEQYGEIDVAKADYAHVEKPDRALDVPASAYVLAQSRLKVLNGSADKRGSGKE